MGIFSGEARLGEQMMRVAKLALTLKARHFYCITGNEEEI